ncbi:MAG: M36 family metallopeptidase [Bacteroidota bacterium]
MGLLSFYCLTYTPGLMIRLIFSILASLSILWPSLALSQDLASQAIDYLRYQQKSLDLVEGDLTDIRLQSESVDRHTEMTHLYFQQWHEGVEVFGAVAGVHLTADGQVQHLSERLEGHIAARLKPTDIQLDQTQALLMAAQLMGIAEPDIEIKAEAEGEDQETWFFPQNISLEPIPVRLVYYPDLQGELHLAWLVRIYALDAQSWLTWLLDTESTEVLGRFDWVNHDHWGEAQPAHSASGQCRLPLPEPMALTTSGTQYQVYAFPIENPASGARTVEIDPANGAASPYGWHDTNGVIGAEYITTRGNNVDAYLDQGDNNHPANGDDDRANGGLSLDFSFPIDLDQAPSTYEDAAVTNLFYWNNILHDILYQYGFDESAGNFQVNNYGNGGLGGDDVRAEAQDGGAFNDANFASPPDGYRPRMQMYVWNTTSPSKAGELDNGIIIHEYAHGLSHRLIGGAGNSFCLLNGEQMGEGWSDWLALLLTMKSGDLATDSRALGTYALGQAPGGPGNRVGYYTTDMAVNDFTYDDIKGLAAPYGTGYGWATILWDLTWAMVGEYGFDADWYNGTGGNNKALQLVITAMKLTNCNPGFIDARDAIIAADQATGGTDACLLWKVFARRGLGYSAVQGSSYSLSDGAEAFDLPPSCIKEVQLFLTASPDSVVGTGQVLTLTSQVVNRKADGVTQMSLKVPVPLGTTYVPNSASHSGVLVNDSIHFPPISLAATLQVERSFQVTVGGGTFTTALMEDDHEYGGGKWTFAHGQGSNDWALSTAFPKDGTYGWFGQDVSSTSDQYLTLASSVMLSGDAYLQFWHYFDTESGVSTAYDAGVVEISKNNGQTWEDLGPHILNNGYNRTVSSDYGNPLAGRSAFGGKSDNYVRTDIDLSSYGGANVLIRFRLATDSSVGGDGWYIDGVRILDLASVFAEAEVKTAEGDLVFERLAAPGVIILESSPFPVEWLDLELIPEVDHFQLKWATASETNNAGFELQRSLSADFTFSQAISWVDGAGNAQTAQQYLVLDEAVIPGQTYFYRLKQVDVNGRFSYSQVLSGRLLEEAGIDLRLFPNPSDGQVTVDLFSRKEERITLSVLDPMGKVVAMREIAPSEARQQLTLDLSTLSPGVYLIRATQPTYTISKRWVLRK